MSESSLSPAMRINPYGLSHPRRALHDRCFGLYQRLPWGASDASSPRDAIRSSFVFAMSVCHMPRPQGSVGALLDLAFPPGSLPSDEASLFLALSRAAQALRLSRFDFGEGSADRACELAPVFFGGLDWLADPAKARAARLAFCQGLADACASRIFFDARAWDAPPEQGLGALESALDACLLAPWPDPHPLLSAMGALLARGPACAWPASVAARERLALRERGDLGACCLLAPEQTISRRL